jgi:hypothetical protein
MTADLDAIHDTYFFLYEQSAFRRLDLCAYDVQYRTGTFSQEVYEAARGQRFESLAAAYRDWQDVGRTAGLPYAPGKDTLLKIVLKVKDEPELIVRWIEHHAAIVGYHNLVIMNCGSTNAHFLQILQGYRDRVLILDYDQYYDKLSFPGSNVALYTLLMRNCKYLTILDADEFLFGMRDGGIAREHVGTILREGQQDIYAGTWLTNAVPPPDLPDGGIDFDSPLPFTLAEDSLREGTFAGKSVVRASLVFQTNYVGHNLHLRESMSHMNAGSFGRLMVFHLANLSPAVVRSRVLKHLYTRGVVPPELPPAQIDAYLADRVARGDLDEWAKVYVNRYLNAAVRPEPEPWMTTRLLSGTAAEPEPQPALAEALGRFDFAGLLRASWDKCVISLR